MAYLAVLFYTFCRISKDVMIVEYMEIMNFCGYDLRKAHEMAKQYGAEEFSELVKEIRRDISDHTERVTDNGDNA